MNSFNNILLIESRVQSYQTFVDSVNANTFPVVFDSTTTKSSILSLLQENNSKIDRVGIVFEGRLSYMFLDNQPLFRPNEISPFSENVQFIIEIIQQFNVQNIDYLGCNTLTFPDWKSYYDIIQTNTNAIVGASNDMTGNIQYGGDWVMETTGTDIELIYFTSSIGYYKYLLGPDGKHVFVLTSKGVTYGCGYNLCGQLGNGNSYDQYALTKMINNTGKTPKLISCGRFHTVVLMTDNTLYSCGQNTYGQLGIGSNDPTEEYVNSSLSLMNVTNLNGATPASVKCGGYHTLVLTTAGTIYGCGYDAYGQLLNKGQLLNNNSNGCTILTYLNISGVVGIECGEFHSVYYDDVSTIRAFGLNKYGQLGNGNIVDGASADYTAMVDSPGGTVLQLACGTYRTVVLMSSLSGTVTIYSCGYNGDGEFGNGTNTNSKTLTQMTNTTGKTPQSIACGERHTIVLMTDGSIYGCGKNEHGELGIGNNYNDQYALTQMTNNTGKTPKQIYAGADFTIVLMTDGSIYGCGYNVDGQLGIGHGRQSNYLIKMSIANNIVGINDNNISLPQPYIRYGLKTADITNDLETFYNTSFIQNMPKPTTYYYINNDSLISNINNYILYMHGTRKSCNYLMNGVDIGRNYQFDDFTRAVDLGPFRVKVAITVWGQRTNSIFDEARWIWNVSNAIAAAPARVYLWFYHTFYYSYASNTGIINTICDNAGNLYFNNKDLGRMDGGWVETSDPNGIQKSINIVNGLNYIRIAAFNDGDVNNTPNPAGLLVTVRDSSGNTITNSNATWAVSTSSVFNTGALAYNAI